MSFGITCLQSPKLVGVADYHFILTPEIAILDCTCDQTQVSSMLLEDNSELESVSFIV